MAEPPQHAPDCNLRMKDIARQWKGCDCDILSRTPPLPEVDYEKAFRSLVNAMRKKKLESLGTPIYYTLQNLLGNYGSPPGHREQLIVPLTRGSHERSRPE